jgi:putative two-component system response regulator
MRKDIIQNSRILIVDDQRQNVWLLEKTLKTAGYQHLHGITDARRVLSIFSEVNPDLVALDLRMPHVDGISLLTQLRSRIPADAFVPILILTADNSRQARQDALKAGAKDFLTKPLDIAEALLRIYNLLETRWLHLELQRHNETLEAKVRDRTRDLEQAQLEILQKLALAAEYRDDCTGRHTQRVGQMAALLGRAAGLSAPHVELLRQAAPLHDVGKIGVADSILLKPGSLTEAEYARIKEHTDIGQIILSGSNFAVLRMAEQIAKYHHERWDGAGYYRVAGESIPLEARIVTIVDVFDVITHARPYKEATTPEIAMERIKEERGKQFDPHLVDIFLGLSPTADLGALLNALEQTPSAVQDLVSPEHAPV